MCFSAKRIHWLINSFLLMSNAADFWSTVASKLVDIRMEMTSFSCFFGKNRSIFAHPLTNCIWKRIIRIYFIFNIHYRIFLESSNFGSRRLSAHNFSLSCRNYAQPVLLSFKTTILPSTPRPKNPWCPPPEPPGWYVGCGGCPQHRNIPPRCKM